MRLLYGFVVLFGCFLGGGGLTLKVWKRRHYLGRIWRRIGGRFRRRSRRLLTSWRRSSERSLPLISAGSRTLALSTAGSMVGSSRIERRTGGSGWLTRSLKRSTSMTPPGSCRLGSWG